MSYAEGLILLEHLVRKGAVVSAYVLADDLGISYKTVEMLKEYHNITLEKEITSLGDK